MRLQSPGTEARVIVAGAGASGDGAVATAAGACVTGDGTLVTGDFDGAADAALT